MMIDGKEFERGICPGCDHRRIISTRDGLCLDCGGHNMESSEIGTEDLQAAAQVYDSLADGSFYDRQKESGFKINFMGDSKS